MHQINGKKSVGNNRKCREITLVLMCTREQNPLLLLLFKNEMVRLSHLEVGPVLKVPLKVPLKVRWILVGKIYESFNLYKR